MAPKKKASPQATGRALLASKEIAKTKDVRLKEALKKTTYGTDHFYSTKDKAKAAEASLKMKSAKVLANRKKVK